MKYFTKIRITWIIAIALTAVNLTMILLSLCHSSSCENQQRDRNPHKSHVAKECMLKSELKLSDLQVVKYDSIKNNHHIKSRPIVDSLNSIRSNLMTKLKMDIVDAQTINPLVNQINLLSSQLFTLSIEQYLEIKLILDSAQQESLSKVYCDMFGCSKKHKGCDSNKHHHQGEKEQTHECNN